MKVGVTVSQLAAISAAPAIGRPRGGQSTAITRTNGDLRVSEVALNGYRRGDDMEIRISIAQLASISSPPAIGLAAIAQGAGMTATDGNGACC